MTDMIPRAEADARVAAAFEAAERACNEVHTTGRLHGPLGTIAAIRALTPDDARAALEAMLAEAEKRGMLRAAEIAGDLDPEKPTNYLHRREDIPAAIRAEAD